MRNTTVYAVVSSLRVECPHEGCGLYVTYHKLADHQSVCPLAPCKCPMPGCGYESPPPSPQVPAAGQRSPDDAAALPLSNHGQTHPPRVDSSHATRGQLLELAHLQRPCCLHLRQGLSPPRLHRLSSSTPAYYLASPRAARVLRPLHRYTATATQSTIWQWV